MHLYSITRKNLLKFLDRLRGSHNLYAPVKKDGVISLGLIESINDVLLDFKGHVLIPLKKLLIPSGEVLYEYMVHDRVEIIDHLSDLSEFKGIIFGVRACDIRSLEILDKVFSRKFHDPYYQIRRENIVIIGLTCRTPDDNCFCLFTRSGPEISGGYDLLLTEINNEYLVEIGSDKGRSIIDAHTDLFKEVSSEYLKVKAEIINRVKAEMRSKLDLPFFDEIYDEMVKNFNASLWDEISSRCLSCGKCNFVCPTCHCFDIRDEFNPIRSIGKRIRVWDSCHFLSFTRVASGEIFRRERSSRIKQRVYHKIVYSVNEIGMISCTGCGRCITVCPAGIDIRQIVSDLVR